MFFSLVRQRFLFAAALLFAFPSCTYFSGKPPLPKHASIEHLATQPSATDFAALVAEADVIYFPGDRAASGARSEPSALLLEALQQSGKPIAIGWDLIDASQQPLLDELQAKPKGEREELIARLELIGTGRAREHCRAVLRDASSGIRQIALRCPATILLKLASGERPTSEEEKELPRGYHSPEGGMENYAERLASRHGPTEANLAQSYRAQLLTQEFAAEQIVRHFRAVGGENKLLVFLSRADLEQDHGVPAYVAQKLSLHQLVLGPDLPRVQRPKILTFQRGRRPVQIVDRTPAAARH